MFPSGLNRSHGEQTRCRRAAGVLAPPPPQPVDTALMHRRPCPIHQGANPGRRVSRYGWARTPALHSWGRVILRTSHEHFSDNSGKYQGHLRDSSGTFPKHLRDISGTIQGLFKDIVPFRSALHPEKKREGNPSSNRLHYTAHAPRPPPPSHPPHSRPDRPVSYVPLLASGHKSAPRQVAVHPLVSTATPTGDANGPTDVRPCPVDPTPSSSRHPSAMFTMTNTATSAPTITDVTAAVMPTGCSLLASSLNKKG